MSFLIFILVLSILIVVHEFGHFIAARTAGIKVEVFSIGFGPALFKRKFKTFTLFIRAIPLGGYVNVAGFSQAEYKGKPNEFLSKPIGIRALVVAAGPVFNYFLAWFIFCFTFFAGFSAVSSRIGELMDGYPAKAAGLKEQDLILEIQGEKVTTWLEVLRIIHNRGLEEIKIKVLRDGSRELDFEVIPKKEEARDIFGRKRVISLVGIRNSNELIEQRYPFFEAVERGSKALFELTAGTFKALGSVVLGLRPFREMFGGPLRIYQVTKEMLSFGIMAVVNLVGGLSMTLAIINILPFPVLDGGHIFFLIMEKFRRRRLSEKTEELITRIGTALIIIFVIFVLYNDIVFQLAFLGK